MAPPEPSFFCPACNSRDVLFSPKRQVYICEDCRHEFGGIAQPVSRRIFISYGHDEHAQLAARLKTDLVSRGHEVWFDLDRLRPGSDWERYIEEGLEWAAADPGRGRLILLMTPHSVRRPDGYCLNEISRALERRLPLIPVMVVWCEPPLSICRIQWLDMKDCLPLPERNERYDYKFNQLADALEQDNPPANHSQARLLQLLQPLPFEADILQHLSRFTGRRWILDRITEWLGDSSAGRIFWILAPPGAGKTALSAWLCSSRREVAAFHLCRHGHALKADPRRAVLSIAYQLSSQLPDYQNRLAALPLEAAIPDSNAQTLFDLFVVQPLSAGFPVPDRTVVVLIDGLDESTSGGRNELAEFIAAEFLKTPPWLRLILTSRPDPAVTHPLQGLTPYVLDANLSENEADIRLFLTRELGALTGQAPDPAVLDAILHRSEGLFLYAEWLRSELAEGRLSLDRTDEFPQGLGGIYARFFQRQFPDIARFESHILPALEAIAAARQPLTLTDLAALFGWSDRERAMFARAVAGLFPAPDGVIRPFHRSLLDWLQDPGRAGPYYVSGADGHRRLAEWGWREHAAGADRLGAYNRLHLARHLLALERWDDLAVLLSDLHFIAARCAHDDIYDLVGDFRAALDALPENQPQRKRDADQAAACRRWIRESAEYAARATARQRVTPGDGDTPPAPVLPAVPPARMPAIRDGRKEESIPAGGGGGRASRLRAFAQFLGAESHDLALFGDWPGYLVQQAANSASSGPLAEAAADLLTDGATPPLLVRAPAFRPPYNPRPALLRTLAGHTDWVWAAAMTPDGQRIVSGGMDGTLRLWEANSGQCLRTIGGFAGSVAAVAVSADGRRAVTAASGDNRIRTWDLESGEQLGSLYCPWGAVYALALTPDGGRMALGCADKWVRLVDLAGGDAVELHSHRHRITAVSITPDGGTVVSASLGASLRVWNVSNRRLEHVLSGHAQEVRGVAVTPGGERAASAGGEGTVRIWDLSDGSCVRILSGHTREVYAVALSADGRLALSCSNDETVRLWNVANGECLRVFHAHQGTVLNVAMAADGRLGASSGKDGTLRLWDLDGGRCPPPPDGHAGWIEAVALTPDGAQAATAGRDLAIAVWDTPVASRSRTLAGHTASVFALAATSDGRTLLSGGKDHTVRCWNRATGECTGVFTGHAGEVAAVAVLPGGREAMSVGWDKRLLRWEMATGTVRMAAENSGGFLYAVAPTPDGRLALTGDADGRVRLWCLDSGDCLDSFEGHRHWVEAVAVAPDGRTALSGSRDHTLRIWDLPARRCRFTDDTFGDAVIALAVSPDARWAVAGSLDRTIRVLDLGSGETVLVATHPAPVAAIALRGRRLLVGDRAGQPTVYELYNLPMGAARVTAEPVDQATGQDGSEVVQALCPWCGRFSAVPAAVLTTLASFRSAGSPAGEPPAWLSLGVDAWDHPDLAFPCPHCAGPLRSNPFRVEHDAP